MSRPPAARGVAPHAAPLLLAEDLHAVLPDGRVLLDALTLGVGRERIGLVGPNGSGKSTLLRLLAAVEAPRRGRVHHAGRVGWLPQEPLAATGTVAGALGVAERLDAVARALDGCATARDLELAADAWDLAGRVGATLARVGLDGLAPDRAVRTLSGGERTRVALAALLLDAPDVLLLDEPTNHLDAPARDALARLVEGWRGGLVVASHDRALLDRMDRLVELSPLGVRTFGGGWSAFEAARAAEREAAGEALARARAALRRTERDLREQEERRARRDARGRRERDAGRLTKLELNGMRETAQSSVGREGAQLARVHDAARERVREARGAVAGHVPTALPLPTTGLRARALVVEATAVAWRAPDGHLALAPTSLAIVGPARVAVTGANGSGKSTLLRLLAGALAPTAGTLRRGVPADALAWLDQEAALPGSGDTVEARFASIHPTLDGTACRLALARVGFRADAARRPVAALSGGERLRVALAATLAAPRPPALLLLDEPTNHLDLDAVRAVEEALAAYDGALVVVSHDPAFRRAVGAEREVALRAP